MDESIPLSVLVILWLPALLVFFYYVRLYIFRGREYRFPRRRYLRDPKKITLTPAQVGYIWRMGHVTEHEFNATLLDLADRGVIEITDAATREDALLTLTGKGGDELLSHETALLDLLFVKASDDGVVTLGAVSFFVSEQAGEYETSLIEFKQALVGWAETDQIFERQSFDARARGQYAGGAMVVMTLLAALITDYGPLFIVGLPLGLTMFVAAPVMLRESRPAARVRAQAEALQRYLRDFGRLQEKPPGGVVVWSRYLVFAELFGMADEVRHELLKHTKRSSLPFGSLTMAFDAIPSLPPVPDIESETDQDDDAAAGGLAAIS